MQKCKKCERVLQRDELEYCPACASSKSHKIKKIIEMLSIPLIAMATYKFFKKNK
jgi:Zn finger protein HypA/HybF involved in hydrogenase expression